MNLDYIISNLSPKVRCYTRHLCRCTVLLKAVRSFVLYVFYSLAESRGDPDGSGGKSSMVDSISKCVYVLLVRIIMQN